MRLPLPIPYKVKKVSFKHCHYVIPGPRTSSAHPGKVGYLILFTLAEALSQMIKCREASPPNETSRNPIRMQKMTLYNIRFVDFLPVLIHKSFLFTLKDFGRKGPGGPFNIHTGAIQFQ